MAERKFGKTYKMSERFEDYSYIINGVGGIGKTTLVYELGKIATGSNEGTFIITCGGENKPKHIPDAFGDVAPDFKTFMAIVKELCTNKEAYPDTKFIAIDSLDEYARITENYVIQEWNATCDINDRAKSISQAYKGFQKGESRACDLMIQQILKLQDAGYSILEIGHTKTKTKEDTITKIQFEQLTCNLDNKYYNALKDKVNLVAMCYWESVIENVSEKKNAFTKKTDKIGDLVDRKRVMVFADDDNAIDTKSHFEYITHKIDLSAELFIKAVEDAIQEKLNSADAKPKKAKKVAPVKEPEPEIEEEEIEVVEEIEEVDNLPDPSDEDDIFAADEVPFDLDDEPFDEEAVKEQIRKLHKAASPETKKAVKAILGGAKLNEVHDAETLNKVLEALA